MDMGVECTQSTMRRERVRKREREKKRERERERWMLSETRLSEFFHLSGETCPNFTHITHTTTAGVRGGVRGREGSGEGE